MPQEHTVSDAGRRERWIVLGIAITVALGRSALFVFRPEAYFDSDQAIFGLMAKHLAELRAFPLFMYGQSYILGVEAWLAAPLFVVFGASATALKLPLFLMNAAIVWLLLRTFERETQLRPLAAGAAALPFVLPAVALSAMYVEPSGGNLEPYLYVLLIWVLRDRPVACGLLFAIGFLQREFTVYGLVALLAIELFEGRLLTRGGLRQRAAMLGVAASGWLAIQALRPLSSGSGPGTSIDQLYGASNNIVELATRTCFSPATAIAGVQRLFVLHWPELLGTAPYRLSAFAIESRMSQGLQGSSWLPAGFVVLSIVGIAAALLKGGVWTVPRFPLYLVLVGVFSAAGYVLGRCGEVNFAGMRYELLSVLGIVGLAGWFLAGRPPRALLIGWSVSLALWTTVLVVPHIRLVAEYRSDPPVPAKRQLIAALDARGVRYGTADYWLAYYVAFLTRERIILAADHVERLRTYRAIVSAHSAEAVRLSRRPCDGGTLLIPGVYQCP